MTYRERREARAERLRAWADSRDAKAAGALEEAQTIMDGIPFGQPILVGHHSEGRARRDAGRIDTGLRRHAEHAQTAATHRGKANNIDAAADRAIYSDDLGAVELLAARVAELEAERERIKTYNASCRKGSPDESLLDERQRAKLASVKAHAPYALGSNGAFPSYALSNLSGNIARNRKRLTQLQRAAS